MHHIDQFHQRRLLYRIIHRVGQLRFVICPVIMGNAREGIAARVEWDILKIRIVQRGIDVWRIALGDARMAFVLHPIFVFAILVLLNREGVATDVLGKLNCKIFLLLKAKLYV